MVQLNALMTKRKKGQVPYESEHPIRIEMPDVPGHRQKGNGKTVNKEQKREMDAQIDRLRTEIVIPDEQTGEGSENKG